MVDLSQSLIIRMSVYLLIIKERWSIMGTIAVLVILIVIVGLIVKSMINDKKAGKSISCGGNCKNCKGGCH